MTQGSRDAAYALPVVFTAVSVVFFGDRGLKYLAAPALCLAPVLLVAGRRQLMLAWDSGIWRIETRRQRRHEERRRARQRPLI